MTTIKDAVNDLFNNQRLTAEEAIDRHFGPAFRQRTDGSWDDRHVFVARMVHLREIVERASITVLDELIYGNRYAERHVVQLDMRDGQQVRREVYVFAERDPDGRFDRIEETSFVLEE